MIDVIFIVVMFIGMIFCGFMGYVCLTAADALYPKKPKKKPLKKKRDPIITLDACINYGLAVAVYYGMVVIAVGRILQTRMN